MKKSILIALVLLLGVYFFPKPYTSSPGFVSQEAYQAFNTAKPTCFGYTYLTNREATYADAPGRSFCFGWLIK